MQSGPNTTQDPQNPAPVEVVKSKEELFEEVFNGHFENARACLKQQQITDLCVFPPGLRLKDLSLISKALQGTAVTAIFMVEHNLTLQNVLDFAKNLPGTSIRKLFLGHNKIGSKGLKEFVKLLVGTAVREIDLSNNGIDDEGLMELAEGLQGTEVTHITLDKNNMTLEGAKNFAQALQGTKVTSISFADNGLGQGTAEFIQKLQTMRITILNLAGNGIRVEGALVLSKILSEMPIVTLNVSNNSLRFVGATTIVESLKNTARAINLSSNELALRDLTLLGKAFQGTRIKSINLSFNHIGENLKGFIENLQRTEVTSLDLKGNLITDTRLVDLVKALRGTRVRVLDLDINGFSLQGFDNIIPLIPETYLTKIESSLMIPSALAKALVKNNFRKNMAAPLMFGSMRETKDGNIVALSREKQYLDCKSVEEQLQFVWQLLQGLPQDLKNMIVDAANFETGFTSGKAITHFFHAKREPLEITLKADGPSAEKRSVPDNEGKKPSEKGKIK